MLAKVSARTAYPALNACHWGLVLISKGKASKVNSDVSVLPESIEGSMQDA